VKGPRKQAQTPKKAADADESPAPANSQIPAVRSTSEKEKPQQEGEPGPDLHLVSRSPEETFEIGRSIAADLKGPAVILLSGDLGAGKTLFAKGVAAGLDIDPIDVTSPSFTLVNVHEGRLRLYHIDLYRLESGGLAGLGLEEIYEDPRGVIVIEWSERLPQVPQGAIRVGIEYLTETSRKILIDIRPPD
jgi:tRNA threonylcarbamoyladenosine biosynthesis protein TsaE